MLISAQTYETSWLAFLIPLSVAVLLLWLPGLLIGFTGGLRKSELVAWAPAGSVASIAVAAIVSEIFGGRWGIVPLIVLTLAFSGLSLFFSRLVWRVRRDSTVSAEQRTTSVSSARTISTAAIVGVFCATFLLALIRFASIVHTPGAFAQTWDNLFHLNVIQGIVEGASPSSLNISSSPLGGGGFYPAAWHDYASLIVLVTGAPAATAEIAAGIVASYLAWPLGIYALSKAATNNRTVALISIPLAVAFPQFPSNFLSYGTLYPNMLAICLLPVVVAFVVRGLKQWNRQTWKYVFFVAIGSVSIALAQPNAVIGFVLIVIAVFYGFHIRHVYGSSSKHRILKSLGITVLWLAILLVFNFGFDLASKLHSMRTGYEYWQPQGNIWQGLLQLLSASGGRQQGNPELVSISLMAPLGVVILLGLYALVIRKKELWVASSYIGLAVLFMMSFSLTGALRVYAVGIWYCEVPRVWALLMPFLPMLAATGLYFAVQKIISFCTKKKRNCVESCVDIKKDAAHTRTPRSIGLAAACVAVAALALFSPHTRAFIADARSVYSISDTSFVDKDEYALFGWMRGNLPENIHIVANPWEGGGFSWAIGGSPSLYSTMNMPGNEDLVYLAQHFNAALTDPKVCQIVEKYNVAYALDLEDEYLWGGSGWDAEKQYSGFDGTADAGIGKVVKQFGDAKLVEITACGK